MNPTELQAHVCQFFVEQADLTSDDLVVWGVSGGVDSMTLADVSVRVAQETGSRFCIAHFAHGLRENTDMHARLVQQFWDLTLENPMFVLPHSILLTPMQIFPIGWFLCC